MLKRFSALHLLSRQDTATVNNFATENATKLVIGHLYYAGTSSVLD